MVKITFFNKDENLGTYDCPEGSSQEQRNQVALDNHISSYTKFVLDGGRVTGYVDENMKFLSCEYGDDGNVQ